MHNRKEWGTQEGLAPSLLRNERAMETEDIVELVDCADCGEPIQEENENRLSGGVLVHEDCYWETHFMCAYCDTVRDRNDLIHWAGANYCDNCVYICHDCDNRYFIHEGCEYCTENQEDDSDGILDYGARAPSFLGFLGNPKDKMFFGVELEVEDNSGYRRDTAEQVRQSMPNFVITKDDGSLNNGFEIVTAPASLEEQYKRWEPFFSHKWPLLSFKTTTCGMHIHISRNALTPSQLGRMYVFVHEPDNVRFIEQIAGRSLRKGNGYHYSKLLPKQKLTDRVGIQTEDAEYRYDAYKHEWILKNGTGKKITAFKPTIGLRGAINDSNAETIEFRIFKGTLAKEGFFKNLEFVRALTQFCIPGVVSLGDVGNADKFKEFVHKNRKEYRYLDAFIKARDARQRAKEQEKQQEEAHLEEVGNDG